MWLQLSPTWVAPIIAPSILQSRATTSNNGDYARRPPVVECVLRVYASVCGILCMCVRVCVCVIVYIKESGGLGAYT